MNSFNSPEKPTLKRQTAIKDQRSLSHSSPILDGNRREAALFSMFTRATLSSTSPTKAADSGTADPNYMFYPVETSTFGGWVSPRVVLTLSSHVCLGICCVLIMNQKVGYGRYSNTSQTVMTEGVGKSSYLYTGRSVWIYTTIAR